MSHQRESVWAVAYRETEYDALIPSIGNPTSAFDLYRAVSLVTTGHEGWNSCYVDAETCAAVARLVEGEIRSIEDLENAELGLQALFWHDRVDVLVPGFKASLGPLSQYERQLDPRSELAFELFRPLAAYDHIFATEKVRVENRQIVASNQRGTGTVGRLIDEAKASYLDLSEVHRAALSSIPFEMSVPAYFADPRLSRDAGKSSFFSTLYDSIATGWEAATESVPATVFAIRIPPLISIVLDRARDRTSIPEAIAELREATTAIRSEMLELSEFVRGAQDQSGVEARYATLQKQFQAIVPASRTESAPLLLPLLTLYKVAKSPLDYLLLALNPTYQPKDPRVLANRTVTGRVFSGLLRTDSMHSLASHFFTKAEVRNLEASTIRRSAF